MNDITWKTSETLLYLTNFIGHIQTVINNYYGRTKYTGTEMQCPQSVTLIH